MVQRGCESTEGPALALHAAHPVIPGTPDGQPPASPPGMTPEHRAKSGIQANNNKILGHTFRYGI